jgi:ribonucleoside-diphosphate reductase alpha chain
MNKLSETLTYYSMEESVAIAKSRGPFSLFKETEYVNGEIPVPGYYEIQKENHFYHWDSLIEKIQKFGIRNSWTTTIAPTGTLSMIADCSNGVEPVFALVFEKRVTVGRFFYTNKIFENILKENGLYTDEILTKIANNYGSVRGLPGIPQFIQSIFTTAIDIHWTDHIMAQSVWQKWISNAIAKTINMPGDVTVEDVKSAYLLSHELGLKGVTVYRDGSRHEQVLHITGTNTLEKSFIVKPSDYVTKYINSNITEPYIAQYLSKLFEAMNSEKQDELITSNFYKNNELIQKTMNLEEGEICPSCQSKLIITEGCNICIECGFSSCVSG